MKEFRINLVGTSATKGRWLLVSFFALAAALVLAGVAGAQISDKYDLSEYLLDGGGGRSASKGVTIDSDVGQSIFGTSTGEQFGIGSGYSPGVIPPPVIKEPRHRVYLPLILRSS